MSESKLKAMKTSPLKQDQLSWQTYSILSIVMCILLGFLFKDSLFNDSLLISSQDQLNHIGGKWFRQSFWLPHWDPNKIGGYPTLDATYGQPYHPLTWFRLIMDPGVALAWMFASTVLMAFLCALPLGSYLTKNWRWGGVLAALFALNPQFFTHIYPGHDGKMMVVAVAPLGVYAILRWTREDWKWGLPLFSISTLLAILGHIQLAYFFLWGIFFISIFENFIHSTQAPLKTRIIKQVLVGVALIAGLGMSAIQVIPPYQYTTTQSVRADAQQKSYGHSASWSNHLEETASLVLPSYAGYSIQDSKTGKFENPYWGHNAFKLNHDSPGLMLLALGVIGLFVRSKWKQSLFIISSASLLIVYSMGGDTLFFKLFYEIVPGAKSFRAPSMVLFWLPILLLISSANLFPIKSAINDETKWVKFGLWALGYLGIGLTIIRFNPTSKGSLTLLVALGFIGLILYFLKEIFKGFQNIPKAVYIGLAFPILSMLVIGISSGPSLEVSSYFSPLKEQILSLNTSSSITSLISLLITAGLAFYFIFKHEDQTQKILGIALIGIFSNLMINSPFLVEKPREKVLPSHSNLIPTIQKLNVDTINTFRTFSVNSRNINSNFGPFYGMRFVLGDHDNKLSTFRSFKGGRASENLLYKLQSGLNQQNIQTNPFLNLLGAKTMLIENRSGQIQLAINDSAFQRLRFYSAAELKPQAEITQYLKSNTSDYRNTLVVDSDLQKEFTPLSKTNPLSAQPNFKFTSTNHSDEYAFETKTQQKGYILFNENFHQDWKIEVNGELVKPIRAFHTLLAFEVPQGDLSVKLKFVSSSVENSKPLVYVGILLLIGLIGFSLKYPWNTKAS